MTLRDLEDVSGHDYSNLGKYEAGRIPCVRNLAILAQALNVTADWLLFGETA